MSPVFRPPARLEPLLTTLARAADDAGLDAYVVGGALRDVLLGREVRDLDIAIGADTLGWASRIAAELAGHYVLLDEQHAIARIVLDNGPVRTIDVARLHGSLRADLRRRDFTIDAMAARVGGHEVIDVCGGLRDLEARRIRMNAPRVFDDDPLRLLRAARVASELGFTVEAATALAVRERSSGVSVAAAERRRDEIARILALDSTYSALLLLDDLRLLETLLPELTHGRGVVQPREHAYDVFEHGLRTVEALDLMLSRERPATARAWMWDELWSAFGWRARELREYFAEELSGVRTRAALLKLAGLLHDTGKPETRAPDDSGRVRFFGHAELGADISDGVLRRYRFSSREVRFVTALVAEHLRPVQLAAVGEVPTRRALFRFFRDLVEAAPSALFLSLADAAAARGPALTSAGWTAHVRYMNSMLVRSIEEDAIVHPPRLVDGHDIMSALGLPEGPIIGKLLAALEDAQGAGEVMDRAGALAFLEARAGDRSVAP